MFEDMLQRVLAEDEEILIVVMGDAVGAHLELMGTLLTADVEDLLLGHVEHRLQREGGFADAGFTTEEYDAARDETATEHPVEFLVVHVDAGIVVVGDVAELEYLVLAQRMTCRGGSVGSGLLTGVGGNAHFLEGVPLPAGGAFSYPLRRLLAAVGAYVCDFVFCHSYCKGTKKK